MSLNCWKLAVCLVGLNFIDEVIVSFNGRLWEFYIINGVHHKAGLIFL